MRDLAVLFGNSAQAAAVDLAVFFGGIAAGAALFARAAPRITNPLRAYGLLELGIAASALLFFALLDAYGWLYAPLYRRFAAAPSMLVLVKAVLAAGLLSLPAMLMGATVPAMVQHAPSRPAWLYGVNTFGGTLGAFAAGFFLPPTLGFRGSYLLAVGVNVMVGLAALGMSRRNGVGHHFRAGSASAEMVPDPEPRRRAAPPRLDPRRLAVLAFASGALTIGLEVAWLRMFAQVIDNSVYAFSAIVVVALVSFALASMVVSAARVPPAPAALAVLLAATAVLLAAQPRAFAAFTSGLTPIGGSGGWAAYVREVFVAAAIFVGIPGFAAGLLFPALLQLAGSGPAAGRPVGRLLAVNTAGAITGSLAASFLLLPAAGVWITIAAAAAAYAALALWMAPRPAVMGLAAVAALAAAASAGLAPLRLDPRRNERLLAVWEGSYGTVAVTEGVGGRVLRMNNSYSLGGTVDRIERERIQTLLPLLLHPDPARVFFLGLGTGITAGEAVRHPVERVVVSELVPEVVRASREYFDEWTRGLAEDPRVEITAGDGRQYLAATREAFDVIISDLFVPWHAGTGSLYTKEHFETVRARLQPGGLFAQWLPLFQLTQREFDVIARTLLDVFPHVAIWRGDFYANRPIVALVASTSPMRLDPDRLAQRARALPGGDDLVLARLLPYYAANLGAGRRVLGPGEVNTDQHPVIEYLSPIAQWGTGDGESPMFVSMPFVRFLARLRAEVPPDRDPYLADLTPEQRGYVEAGAHYQRAIVLSLANEDEAGHQELGEALRRLPPELTVGGPFMALEGLVQ